MTGAHSLARGTRIIVGLIEKCSSSLMSRRRRLAAPVLCESLEPRTLLSAVSTHLGDMTQTSYSSDVLSTVTADFNGDGVMDIASTLQEGVLRVSLGTNTNGVVTYDAAKTTNYTINVTDARDLVALDFNGDGAQDLAFISGNGVTIHLGNMDVGASTGNGTFQTLDTTQPTAGLTQISLVKANINDDNCDDLVLVFLNGANGNMRTYFGTSDMNSISTADTGLGAVTGSISNVTTADFDSNGLTDIAYVEDGVHIKIYKTQNNAGVYEFVAIPQTLTAGSTIVDLKIDNMYSQSAPQIFALQDDGKLYISYASNNGSLVYGDFSAYYTFDTSARYLVMGDVNADGYTDFFAVSANGDIRGSITRNMTYSSNISESVSANLFGTTGSGLISSVWLADVNQDGVLDFVSRGQTGRFVGVTLNATYDTTAHTLNSTNRSYSYVDDNGDKVTIQLSGPGSAVINLNDNAKLVESISLTGTTLKSSLAITITNKNKTSPKTTTIGRVILNNCSLGALNAASVNFAADLNLDGIGGIVEAGGTGFVKKISVRDFGDDTKITLSTADSKNLVTFKARVVGSGCYLYFTNQLLNSATFVSFGDSSRLRATTLGKLSVTGDKKLGIAGDFAGYLSLEGIENSKGYALNSAVIAGKLATAGDFAIPSKANVSGTASGFHINGKVGSITVGSMDGSIAITVEASLSKLIIKGDLLSNGGVDTKYGLENGPSGGIRIGTELSSLTIKGNCLGGITAGRIGTMAVSGQTLDCRITIEGITGKNAIDTLKLSGAVENLTLSAEGNIKTFNAKSLDADCDISATGNIASFITSADFNGILTAASIGSMTVTGNITNADLTLNAVGATKPVLKSLTVKGNAVDLDIISSGDIGSVSAKTFATDASFSVTGAIKTLMTTKGDFSAAVTATGKLSSWIVKGNLTGTTATLGSNTFAANTYMLGTLSVTGSIATTTIFGYGSISSISAKTLDDSRILAGSTAVAEVSNAGDFVSAEQKIDTLKISGSKTASSSTIKSVIGARSIGKIALAYPDSANNPSVVANTIATISVTNLSGNKSTTTTDKKLTGAMDDPHAGDNVTLTLFGLQQG